MPLPYGRRRANANIDEEEDTKSFLLDRKVEVKENKDVEADYKIGEYIGSGKFGDVSKCIEKSTGYELAAKVIPIHSPEDTESVMNEVSIMNKLRHARLIQLYDVYTRPDKITLIMELITGGELFERIIDENFELNEDKCVRFMTEILQGVDYMHSQKVLHLDLKPENILCLTRTGFRIKIIDFGLARELTDQELRVLFGTPEFVAPEVISYDPVSYASDMWSVGVICYVLLSGLSPFMGDNESETLSNIIRCVYSFDYSEFDDISKDAKDFIRKLLVKDTKKRFTSTQCLAHSWLRGKGKIKRSATVNKARLKHFVYRRKWQKAVNAIIALQRMGVVLTHNNEKTNIRKYLQVAPSKTTKFTRRGSIQPPPKENPAAKVDVKRNMSFQSSSSPPLRKPAPTTFTVEDKLSADAGKPTSPVERSQKENAKVPKKQNAVPLSVTKTTNEGKPSPAATDAAIPKPQVIVEPSKQEAKASLRSTIQEPNKTPEQSTVTSQPSRNRDKQPMKVQEPDKTKPSVLGSTAKEPTRLQEQEKKVAQPPRITVQETNKSLEGGLRAPILPKEPKLNSNKQPIKIQEPDKGQSSAPGSAAKELTRLKEKEKKAVQEATIAPEVGSRALIPPKEQKLNSTAPAPATPKPTSPQPQNWLITKQQLPPPTAATTASSSRRTSTTSTASTASSARAAAQNLVAVKMASLSKNTTTLASRIQAFAAAAEAAENKTRRKKFSLYQ